jgi:hypothetical protein
MPRSPALRFVCGSALVLSLLPGRLASADPTPSERESARELMAEGDKKLAAKDAAGAYKAYAEAHRLMNVPTTGLEVARVAESLGRFVEARDTCLLAAKLPTAPSEPKVFAKARRECAALAESVGPKLATLELAIAGAPGGAIVTVEIDGVPTTTVSATLSRRVDPGKRHVVAHLDGYADAKGEVVLEPGSTQQLKLALSRASAAPPATSTPSAAAPPPVAPPAPADAAAEAPSRVPAYVAWGVGGVGLVVGTVFGVRAIGKKGDRDELCPGGRCTTQAGLDRDGEARSSALVSTVGVGVGVVGAAVGTWLFVRGGSKPSSTSLSPMVGRDAAGVVAGGSF